MTGVLEVMEDAARCIEEAFDDEVVVGLREARGIVERLAEAAQRLESMSRISDTGEYYLEIDREEMDALTAALAAFNGEPA